MYIQGGLNKRHNVSSTIILQPYITKSFDLQHNVPKEIIYMTKGSV